MSEQHIAKGTFEVDRKPEAQEKIGDINLARFTINKAFQGDLEATSKVEMLAAGSETNGHGAYVAIERIEGTVNGKSGSFVVTHVGTRSPYDQQLDIVIIPGCGSGDLAGIQGKMTITIADKKHYYELQYQLIN